MRKTPHAPPLDVLANIRELEPRRSPYWNILQYCRHLGLEKLPSGKCHWLARVRCKNGHYKQCRLGAVAAFHEGGLTYDEATVLAEAWFRIPGVSSVASAPFSIGPNQTLHYEKTGDSFTVGDALLTLVDWKRVSAAKTYFETTLSLINHHIIPRLGNTPVEDLNQGRITQFCIDVLESAPKRGNQSQGSRTPLEELDHEQLRKRKKTLNALIGLLRMALQMAWENGDVESERSWRRLRRLPHADSPRQYFLTRAQAKRLLASCRTDLSLLVMAALYTGCRVSELARLKARDVGNHVFGIYVAPMKSYRGRYVILPEEGMSFFLDQADGLEDEDLLFRTLSGKSWERRHKGLFKEAVRMANLPEGFVFHGLRHTYASQLVQAGTPLAIVAKQLGHSNTDTVSRTYGHLCQEGIETEITHRFAPLKEARKDGRLKQLRKTLQTMQEPSWSWPQKNRSRASGTIVEMLREKEDQLRNPDS